MASAARALTISDTGVEIHSRRHTQSLEWIAMEAYPEKAALWFLHMVTVTTPKGTSRLFFRNTEQQNTAWKALVRAWYLPRVTQAQTRLDEFEESLKAFRYLRTSKWEPFRQRAIAWKSTTPPVPPEDTLVAKHQVILARMQELVQRPETWLTTSR